MKTEAFQKVFEQASDPEKGQQMQAYLKGQFPFYGLQAASRRKIQSDLFKSFQARKQPLDLAFVQDCWDQDKREFQYLAIDYLRMKENELGADHLPFLVELIETKSWWDTVDMLAAASIGSILKGHEELIMKYADQWIDSGNFWLQRTAILYQLKYKEEMDFVRLKRYCLKLQDEKEFFIRKAIGWILREASKRSPEQVKDILESGHFSGLTVREASKYLEK